jgi:penicillin-binding protein 2B
MKKKMKVRSLLIGTLFTILFMGLVGRLYWVQIVEASFLIEKAESAWSHDTKLPATRGTIFDRNNKILAQDGSAYTVVVQPQIIHSRDQQIDIVEALSPILHISKDKLMSLITRKKENGEYLSQVEVRNEGWKIDSEIADQIRIVIDENHFKGIFMLEEQKRYYPAQDLASHVLGYSNKEGEAVLGLEAYYDDKLKGESGVVHYDKDGKSYELPDSKVTYKPAVHGMSMKLTIDENIQLYIDQALEAAYEQYSPKSISAIAVDPNTMEVLGMGNYPNYNPNEYWSFSDYGDFYNHAIASTYEPGSTFKIVTLAGAVEEGLFDPNDTYKSGRISLPGGVIHDHNRIGWGEITYLEGLKRSSNVAFVNLGYEKLGADKLKKYINEFGFGQNTGIDLPGEVSGSINFRNHIPTEVATVTFGQGRVAVTAIQQIAAISAIANGGKLLKPYLVKEIINPETNEVIESFEPEVVRQVISEETSRKVGEYLEQVVSDQSIGTGRTVYLEGYRVAGKTGTAQKVVDGKYSDDKWIVSFIGYAPVENPKIAIIVIADEPDIQGDYRLGSGVSAPVFKEVMSKSLRYFGVASKPKESIVTVSSLPRVTIPDVTQLSAIAAENEIKKNGLEVETIGSGKTVINQFPSPETEIASGQRIYILTQKPEYITTPDFTEMSLRDAFQLCGLLQMGCQVEGEGYVVEQKETKEDGLRNVKLFLQPLSQFSEEVSEEDSAVDLSEIEPEE